jgi:hypothetical protein
MLIAVEEVVAVICCRLFAAVSQAFCQGLLPKKRKKSYVQGLEEGRGGGYTQRCNNTHRRRLAFAATQRKEKKRAWHF